MSFDFAQNKDILITITIIIINIIIIIIIIIIILFLQRYSVNMAVIFINTFF
jgi:heme/copper-type cytochrome/quinol oxidase subunit 2